MISTPQLISEFSSRFVSRHLNHHAAASPVGFWLLLALLAPSTSGPQRAEIETVLGTSGVDAFARAKQLLTNPHPDIMTALGFWLRLEAFKNPKQSFRVNEVLTPSPIPSQEEANLWAEHSTGGLIKEFPLEINDDTILVLASALSASSQWNVPFGESSRLELGGVFGKADLQVLHSAKGHESYLLQTKNAGVVGVHLVAGGDTEVMSVIADEVFKPETVHLAALEILSCRKDGTLKEYALGVDEATSGSFWAVEDTYGFAFSPETKLETFVSLLPVWSAESKLDLTNEPGMDALRETLSDLVTGEYQPVSVEAAQNVVFSYEKEGFKAAAVSSLQALRGAGARTFKVPEKKVTIKFNHPYAVVAYPSASFAAGEETSPWGHVPVFQAWVENP